MSDAPEFAHLTTTGRRTRKPHRIEIWYFRDGDVVWFISGGLANSSLRKRKLRSSQ